MTFAAMSSGALIATAAATTLAVVALYFLQRKPHAQTVSNVEFWRRAAEKSPPRSLLATRIPWLVMLLSLATAGLLVLEMGDPRPGAGFVGTTVIVLAADRTMAARDENGRRRIDDALAIVHDTVQADSVTGNIAIVRAGVRSEVIVPLTHRAADAERVLVHTETDDATADLSAAIAIARTIVRTARGPGRVVVVADRREQPVAPDAAIPVAFVVVGAPAETLAITALDARRDPLAFGEYAVRCEVRSYSARAARAHLVIRDRNVVVAEQNVVLAPGATVVQLARGFSSAQGELTARLEGIVIDGGHDALASDDTAYAVVAPVVATRVLLATRGNRFLENALLANPSVDLEKVDAAGLAAHRNAPGGLSRYQVVILDRIASDPPLDHPGVLVVGASDPHLVRLGSEIQAPRVTAFAADHRALAGLRFDQVQITHARALLPESDDRVLVQSGRDALAIARERGGARMIALGFDTDSTDLVQRIAFPLFIHNAIVWLDRRERDFHSWQSPGEPIRATGSPAIVLAPNGDGRDAHGALYDTGRAGIYHTTGRAVAVSAADEASSLATTSDRTDVHPSVHRTQPPLAVIVCALMLALLCAEWVLTQRGRLQ